MAPLGWKWAGFVWGYAIAWALVNDRIKLLAYKIFDPVKVEPNRDGITVAKPGAKGEPKPETEADASKPEAQTTSDSTPQISKRAYELYEQRAGSDGTAVQDWKKAELEIRSDKTKGPTKPEAMAGDLKPGAKAEPDPEAKNDATQPEAKAESQKIKPKTDQTKPEAEAQVDSSKPERKAEASKTGGEADQPEPKANNKTRSDVSPQLVKRVHELFEQLGREDVQTVQDWEREEPELQSNESKK
jgi:H+-transporting ATPase